MSEPTLISNRLPFNVLDRETLDALREGKPLILAELPKVLDGFYEHMGKFQETARFFRGREHMNIAKAAQVKHWSLIADARFDDAYTTSVTKIGETHFRFGLSPRWYIGGYNFLISNLVEAVSAKMLSQSSNRTGIAKCTRVQRAIIRAALLDMDLAISVYIQAGEHARATALKLAAELQAQVNATVENISATASDLNATANMLTNSANNTTERSNTVAAGAEEASINVRTVAAAAEELAASVKEVGRYTASSGTISQQAVSIAGQAMQKVEQLAEAAKKIGVIVDLISSVQRVRRFSP